LLNNCLNFAQSWFNQDCLLCGAASGAQLLCDACHHDLPRPAAACPRCAAPGSGETCGACLQHPPAFDRAVAALEYTFPVDKLIQSYKYHQQLALARLFGALLHQSVRSQPQPDAILPLPLHPARLRERGFNQAHEIAKGLAKDLRLPLAPQMARRIVNTAAQASLDWEARKKNMKGAFVCEQPLDGRHVALVDDVMTSGATLHEAAQTLKRAGAAQVSLWVVARAAPQY
jgi:ComF family protein